MDAGKRTRIAIKQELKQAVGEVIRTGAATTEKFEHAGDNMVDAAKRTRIAIKQELKHAAEGAIRTGEATTEKLAHGGDDMVDAAKRTHKAIKQAIRTVTVTTEKSALIHEDTINLAVGVTPDTTEHISQLKGRIKKPFWKVRDLLKSSP